MLCLVPNPTWCCSSNLLECVHVLILGRWCAEAAAIPASAPATATWAAATEASPTKNGVPAGIAAGSAVLGATLIALVCLVLL